MSQLSEIDAGIARYDSIITPECTDAGLYYERGKLHWKAGHRAEAISDFNRAVAVDPDSPARLYLNMTGDIMDFYHTDLYNP